MTQNKFVERVEKVCESKACERLLIARYQKLTTHSSALRKYIYLDNTKNVSTLAKLANPMTALGRTALLHVPLNLPPKFLD